MIDKNSVICICRGIGFPYGLAQTHRIRMVGKAAIAKGLRFTVLHIGGSPTDHNTSEKGEFEGIRFEYLPASVAKPARPLARKLSYLKGSLQAVARVREMRAETLCVYAWVGRGGYGLLLKALLKLLGVPVVQEVNEWWPGRLEWVKNAANLALSDGTMAISRHIEERLAGLCSTFRLRHRIARVPVLADAGDHGPSSRDAVQSDLPPYVLWCGNLEGYLADVRFMLEALRLVLAQGGDCTLVLVGACSDSARRFLAGQLEQLGLPGDRVRVPGYVTDAELKNLMCSARALLLPLWDDDRSRCRFPNKIGEYLFSERPVITCAMGDVAEVLTDGKSAHVCRPGDVDDFARRICLVLQDPSAAELMSRRGREQAIRWLDWRENAETISTLFTSVAGQPGGGRP